MRSSLQRLTIFAALSLIATSASAQSDDALDRGEVFVQAVDVKGYEYPKLVVTAVVDAPPAKVYEIVTNCDEMAQRMPRVKTAKTLEKRPDSHTCMVTVELPFPLSDLTAITVDRRKQGPDEWYRKWTLKPNTESSYTRNVGAFVLTPFHGDPNRTLVRYSIHAIPKTVVPDFMRKSAQKKSLPKMIERIRDEVRKL